MPRAETFHKFRLPDGQEYQSHLEPEAIFARYPEAKIVSIVTLDEQGNASEERLPMPLRATPKQPRAVAKPSRGAEAKDEPTKGGEEPSGDQGGRG